MYVPGAAALALVGQEEENRLEQDSQVENNDHALNWKSHQSINKTPPFFLVFLNTRSLFFYLVCIFCTYPDGASCNDNC